MKKVFLALMAVVAIALTGCVEEKKSDVFVSWEVDDAATLSQLAVIQEVLDCYDQAAISQGYSLISTHKILLNNQRSLDNATNIGVAIAEAAKAAVEAKKIDIPFPHLIVTVNANGSDLLGSKQINSIEYGLAANPDAKRGINMTITMAKFILDFNDVALYVTDINSQDFKKVDLNFVEKEQKTKGDLSYTVYEAVYEKELTASGKGQYYVELKRNDKQLEDNVTYIAETPHVLYVAGYLGEREYPSITSTISFSKKDECETYFEKISKRLGTPKDYEFTK